MPWDTTFEASPPEAQDHGRGGERIRELKDTARKRLAVQHNVGDATVTAGYTDDGRHSPGSAVAYFGGTEAAPRPTTLWKPDGTALATIPAGSVNLGATDRGRLLVDESGSRPVMRYYSKHFGSAPNMNFVGCMPPENYFINGNFQIWQRYLSVNCVAGATYAPTGSLGTYAADRWFVQPAGANSTAAVAGAFRPPGAMGVTGAGGMTSLWIGQRIETKNVSRMRNTMNSWTDNLVTLSVRILNQRGDAGTITPQYRIDYPAATADDFSAVTNTLAATNFSTTIADGVSAYCSATIDLVGLSSNIGRGMQILINVGALTVGSAFLYEAYLEPGASMSLAVAPRFEQDLLDCQRYYQKTFNYGTAAVQNAGNAGAFAIQGSTVSNWQLSPRMRIAPTVTTYNTNSADALFDNDSGGADAAVTIPATGTTNGEANVTVLAPGAITDRYSGHLQAEADL